MAYTDQQIADYAHQLEAKGAKPSEIETFVRSAKGEQNAAKIAQGAFGAVKGITGNLVEKGAKGVKDIAEGAKEMGMKVTSEPVTTEERAGAVKYLNTKGIVPDESTPTPNVIADSLAYKLSTGDINKELNIGKAKGAASTIMGASELMARGMDAVTKPLQDTIRPSVQSVTEPVVSKLGNAPTSEETFQNMEGLRTDLTEPKTPGEAIGYTAEQIAEFLFPSMALSAGDKAVKGLKVGQKLLNLGKTAGREALVSGAVAAVQRGNFDQEVVDTAIISGAIPIAAAALGGAKALFAKGMNKAAEDQISKLIKPNKNAFLFGKNPSRAIIDEGIVANSFDDLISKIDDKLDDIGKQVETNIKTADASRRVNIEKLIQNNVDDFGKKVVDKKSWTAYSDKVHQLTGEFKPDLKSGQLVKVADKELGEMSAQEIWEMQKKVGKLTQWTGEAGEKEANKQLHKLYRQLGNSIDELAPGTKDLQMRYANMLGASKSAIARKATAQSNNELVKIIGGSFLGSLAPTQEGDWMAKGRNALIGAAGLKFINSPIFRTNLAQKLAVDLSVKPATVNKVVEAIAKEMLSNR